MNSTVSFDYEKYAKILVEQSNGKMTTNEAIRYLQQSSLFNGAALDGCLDRVAPELDRIVSADYNGYKVCMSKDGNEACRDISIDDAVAESFDSILDLYIQEEVCAVMKKYGTCSIYGYLSPEAVNELAMKGIRVDGLDSSTGNGGNGVYRDRIYSFSLVDVDDETRKLMNQETISQQDAEKIYAAVYDADAKIMKDGNDKEASFLFADVLIADGYAQGAETHMSSILDQMGYECISRADFMGHEDEYNTVMAQVRADVQNGSYHKLNQEKGWNVTISDMYGSLKSIGDTIGDLFGRQDIKSKYGAVAYNNSNINYSYTKGGNNNTNVDLDTSFGNYTMDEMGVININEFSIDYAKKQYKQRTEGKELSETEKTKIAIEIRDYINGISGEYISIAEIKGDK
ncbi:hypothetical protein IJ670_06750 [bacterium]|nr:hypothetical protein [bacterium]